MSGVVYNEFMRTYWQQELRTYRVHQDTLRHINRMLDEQADDGYKERSFPIVDGLENEYKPFAVKES